MRESLAERNAIGDPPLIKSGGVSGFCSASLFSPCEGDDDGTSGGDENVGRDRDRDGDPERVGSQDVREEGRVRSLEASLGEVADEAVVTVAEGSDRTELLDGMLVSVPEFTIVLRTGDTPALFNERGARLPKILLPRGMPGDIALVRGDSVHTRAVVLARVLGLRSLLEERCPMFEGGDCGGCGRGASGDSVTPPSEERAESTEPASESGDSDMIDMAVSVGDTPNAVLPTPTLGSAIAIIMGLAPASTDVAIMACAIPWLASCPPS